MVFATAVVLGAALRTSTNFVDDALITLTYAKNLAHGNGFVYNAPPATFGTTSPLWTLMTAALGAVAGPDALPIIALWLSALCWLGIVWIFFLGWRMWGLGRLGAAFVSLLLATSFRPNLGMEQPTFELLLLGLCLLTFQKRFLFAGLAGGLLFLSRGEGALAVALSGVCALYMGQGWRGAVANGLRLSAGFWVVAVPWLLYAWRTFGKILPDTLQSKMQQGLLPGYEQFQDALLRAVVFEWPGEGIAILPLQWGLVLLGIYAAARASGPLRWLLGWTVIYTVAYTLLHVADFWWYEIPVYWTWLICLGVGILKLPWPVSRLPLRWRYALVIALAVLIAGARAYWQPTGPGEKNDVHADIYRPAAIWLQERAPATATLGTTEVGYLGYYTTLQIVDQFGLITPEALALADPHDTAGFLRRFRPDFYAAAIWNDTGETLPYVQFYGLGYRCVGRFAGTRRTAFLLASMRSEQLRNSELLAGPTSEAVRAMLSQNVPDFDGLADYLELDPAQRQRVSGLLLGLEGKAGEADHVYGQILALLTESQLPRFTYIAPTRIALFKPSP